PFAVQPKPEEQVRSPEPRRHESTLADFAILNPEGGRSMPVQPKLAIGQPSDKYEQEADRVATQVMRMLAVPHQAPLLRQTNAASLLPISSQIIPAPVQQIQCLRSREDLNEWFKRKGWMGVKKSPNADLERVFRCLDAYHNLLKAVFPVTEESEFEGEQLTVLLDDLIGKIGTYIQQHPQGKKTPDIRTLGQQAMQEKAAVREILSDLNAYSGQKWQDAIAKPLKSPASSSSYVIQDNDKVTVEKVINMRNDWYDAAIAILKKAEKESQSPDIQKLIQDCENQKKKGPQSNRQLNTPIINSAELEEEFPLDLPKKLVVKVAKILDQQLPEVSTQLRETYIRLINQKEWEPIIRVMDQGTDQQVTSILTPVNQSFDKQTYSDTSQLPGKNYGTSGLSSMSPRISEGNRENDGSETNRPTNLWHTELLDEKGNQIFAAFRSGAFADVGVKSNQLAKKIAGQEKLKGVLEAMVLQKLKACDAKELIEYLYEGKVLTGNVLAIDLLSDSKAIGDAAMVEQHHQAIAAIHNQEIPYTVNLENIGEVEVNAQFNIIDFNTGVNQASSKMTAAEIKQWSRNKEALKNLKHAVRDYEVTVNQQISELNEENSAEDSSLEEVNEIQEKIQELELKRDQAKNLFQEIKSIGTSHVGDYKLAALLANLGYLMDYIVHFNCKSGKDRTGLMDAKSKHLARELHENRKKKDASVPGFATFSERNFEQEQRHQQMLWEGGNLQVLEQNVGGQSLKVADLAAVPSSIDANLMEDLGGSEKLKEIQGLKRYTNIDTIAELSTSSLNPIKRKQYAKDQAIKQEALDELNAVLDSGVLQNLESLEEEPNSGTSQTSDTKTETAIA
ncbi:MAG TPA: inositol phosphate phosphatase SopB, partial [Allocoleopsis sp.]